MEHIVLLDTGAQLLNLQALDEEDPIQITSFKLGNAIGEVMPRASTIPIGDTVYTGAESQIKYTPRHDSEILLKLEVPRTADEIQVGNIVIYANDEVPLIGGINNYRTIPKYKSSSSTAGSIMVFRLILNIPNLLDRFDLSNLSEDVATFARFETDDALTRWPWQEDADQIFIERDGRSKTPAFVVQSGRMFWGSPFVYDFDNMGIPEE